MTPFLDIFGFLSVLLRGTTLAFEALTAGGLIFSWVVVRSAAAIRLVPWSAGLLVAAQIASVAANAAILAGTIGMQWTQIAGAGFCIAGGLMVVGAATAATFIRRPGGRLLCALACAFIFAGSVMNSHSFARVDDRWTVMALTLAHHVAAAAWVGGMPYLLLSLREVSGSQDATAVIRRFSRMAMISVAVIAVAGAGLAYFYVGSAESLVGTTYGIMLASKVVLTIMLLLLGGLNLKIVTAARRGEIPALLPLRRFAEAEVGIGFTILLLAASLTSTPPAIDVQADLAHWPEIVTRMTPKWPRMETPALNELSPATSLAVTEDSAQPGSFGPGQSIHPDSPADIAWSEYNHHWAGIVVFAMGVIALFARRCRWARLWPLMFFGLAAFLFFRSDSENWPLGPRGFWESFQVAEVAQHRIFVVLIILFAIFEWRVQIGRVDAKRAGLVFPLVCAVGGALLLTHSHSLGNVKAEYFAEMSHLPLAILAVAAGWARWLEIRLPGERGRNLSWLWAAAFALIGAILLSYREV